MSSPTTHEFHDGRIGTSKILALLALFALGLVGVLRWNASAQAANPLTTVADHGGVVAEVPRVGLPKVLDGRVHGVIEHEGRIILAGSFTRLQLADGTEVEQPYLAAIDAESGDFIDTFRPVISDEVLAIEVGHLPGTMFIGGRFISIDGLERNRIAEVSVATGTPTDWVSNATGSVTSIDLTEQDRLFVGGSFTKIRGIDISKVAELDPETGKPNQAFNFAYAGTAGRRSGGLTIRTVEATPDGSRLLVIHSGSTIDGLDRRGAAIFDISNPDVPVMTPFSNPDFDAELRYKGYAPVTGDLSPDGSFFVMVSTGFVMAFPTDGGADQAELWHQTTHDSIFSAAISDSAVYIGGHFCHMTSGPGETVREGNFSDPLCPIDIDDPTFRKQIAALNPADGTPLDWDPGSNAFVGIRMLEVLDGGLAIGHDGMWTGGTETGYFAYYPTPAAAGADCSVTTSIDGHPVVTWLDVAGQTTFTVRRDDRWIATVRNSLSFEDITVTTSRPSYEVRYFAGGQRIDLPCGQPPVDTTPAPITPVATQSSTRFGASASRAIDSNTDGVFRNASVTHTADEASPWWQLDQGEATTMTEINVWNREDSCCTSRLQNFYVLVSDSDMSGKTLGELLADPAVQVIAHHLDEASRQTTVTADATGRFVMVRLAGQGTLSLAEVEIS